MSYVEIRDILNSVKEGSSEIDEKIALLFNIPNQAFTSSLDAKLPNENILEMKQILDKENNIFFYAIHCSEPDGVGVHYAGIARTEALARRLAVVLEYAAT